MPPAPQSKSNCHHGHQLLESLPEAGFNIMPLTHTIPMGAGVAASCCSVSSSMWPLQLNGVIMVFLELMSDFYYL